MEKIKAETQWFHVFKDMVDSGDLAKLAGSSIKVYLAIKAHANYSHGASFPGVDLLAKEAGLSSVQVMRCLKELEDSGYLSKTKVGRSNVYKLREKITILDDNEQKTAVATWDYVPSAVKNAVADLKNVVLTGDLGGAKIVTIEKLQVQVLTVTGDNNIVLQAGEAGADATLEKLATAHPELAERLLSMRESREIKKG